jgi:hypothetical protein
MPVVLLGGLADGLRLTSTLSRTRTASGGLAEPPTRKTTASSGDSHGAGGHDRPEVSSDPDAPSPNRD